MTSVEDMNDPRHINQARAWHVALEAERDFARSLGLVDPDQVGPFAMLRAALTQPEAITPTSKET